MSKCVVRMEMPKSCYNCDLRYECNAFYAPGKSKPFMKGCQIICQLPEGHGRLGDLDELAAGCDAPYWCRWLGEIEDAPTIVPADTAERSET